MVRRFFLAKKVFMALSQRAPKLGTKLFFHAFLAVLNQELIQ
ncbi:hypothetical protein Q668_13495 [Alcanivorax sp. PN-3]|nr:hypothetical protein Q668_13495 [Alcanivorax sp. PN-3]